MPRIIEGTFAPPGGRFAICVTRFNAFITEALLGGAVDALVRHGVPDGDLDVFRVPGAFELPPVVRRAAESGGYLGVIALGAVIRGGTPHFEYVSGEVSKGLGVIALRADCAVSFGVLTCDTLEQAIDRAGTKAGNKGAEAALACLEQVNLFAAMAKGKRTKEEIMGARRIARERALQALYQLDMSGGAPEDALVGAWESAAQEIPNPDPNAVSFARELVLGVVGNLQALDALIEEHSHNWRLERMDRIDRNVLRLALFELKFRGDIPRKVTINEAVELARTFGTEASFAFINGLVDRVAVALGKK